MSAAPSPPPQHEPPAAALAALVQDLGLDPRALGPGGRHRALGVGPPGTGAADAAPAQVARVAEAARALANDDALIVWVSGAAADAHGLACWRDVLWPAVHVTRVYRTDGAGALVCETLQGTRALASGASGAPAGAFLVGQRLAHVLSPDFTVSKFDANAAAWNGRPDSAGYAHHRWMRAHVARFAEKRDARRILDFGCGAGWVGIEAALLAGGAPLCAFDPSPAMVDLAQRNARAAGLSDFAGRTGFGEDPPFPAAGEQAFDLVLSSGVISFSPAPERWLDGLARTVAPGGTLVIGDIQRGSRGLRARRSRRPLLPVRELNAHAAAEVRAQLERRGFVARAAAGYQLTSPVPEAMHWSETRLAGLFARPLLWLNRAAAANDAWLGGPEGGNFDSWVLRFERAE